MHKLVTAIIALGFVPSALQAQVITFNQQDPPASNFVVTNMNGISGDSDIFNGGGAYTAVSFGHTTGIDTDVAINGINFRLKAPNSGGYENGSSGIEINETWGTGANNSLSTGFSGGSGAFDALDANYQTILSTSSDRDTGGNKFYNITVEAGTSYRIQIWVNDSSTTGNNPRTFLNSASGATYAYGSGATGSNYAYLNRNLSGASNNPGIQGNVGSYFDATFTADDTFFQIITASPTNAMLIQVVPEPSTYAIITSVFAIALAALRRRKQ